MAASVGKDYRTWSTSMVSRVLVDLEIESYCWDRDDQSATKVDDPTLELHIDSAWLSIASEPVLATSVVTKFVCVSTILHSFWLDEAPSEHDYHDAQEAVDPTLGVVTLQQARFLECQSQPRTFFFSVTYSSHVE